MSGTLTRQMRLWNIVQGPLAQRLRSFMTRPRPQCQPSYAHNGGASIPVSPGWCRNFVRTKKNNMSRLVLNMEDPAEKHRGSKKESTADTKPNKSASVFNLTMGEIILGKSFSRIAVEGGRMVEAGVTAGLILEKVFLLKTLKTLPDRLNYLLEEEKEQLLSGVRTPEIHRIGLKSMETWSSLETPPGIIGIFKKPQPDHKTLAVARSSSAIPLTVICDNIREPGNLGSILRSVAGAGCDEVLLTKGCVDPWNMKVLRGGSGAHFHLPITIDCTQELLLRLIDKKIMKITGTGSSISSNSVKSEGEECRFNIAICDSNSEDTRLPGMPSIPFRDFDYTPFSHNFVIVGGETEGISEMCVNTVKLLRTISSVNLVRIRIPLANGIESLNAANACGIVVFEILRQLTK